jgi:hypothetical protein
MKDTVSQGAPAIREDTRGSIFEEVTVPTAFYLDVLSESERSQE